VLKYFKRRRVGEEEDSENDSKLSELSMSKAEEEVTDKKFALTTTVTWSWDLYGLETNIFRFHCAFSAGKNFKYGYGPGEVKLTLHN
jgi:hypothetical protein